MTMLLTRTEHALLREIVTGWRRLERRFHAFSRRFDASLTRLDRRMVRIEKRAVRLQKLLHRANAAHR